MAGISQVLKVPELGQPVDIANLVTFLLSEEAAYLTGQTISLNGGILFR